MSFKELQTFPLFFSIALMALMCKKEPPIVPLPPNAPDTTSHNFIGTQYEFGTSPGFLGDCSIISDSDIWCVGAINEATESTYNAVHWDGKGWELKKISVEYKGNMITPNLEGIFSFSTTDIWVSSGVPAHYDGNSWTQYHLFDMGILSSTDGAVNKIWGISPNNFFIVGDTDKRPTACRSGRCLTIGQLMVGRCRSYWLRHRLFSSSSNRPPAISCNRSVIRI